jgi:hypothetical protein
VLVRIAGSTWGGSMIKLAFIGHGMQLEFQHPEYRTPIVTSRIKEIRQCAGFTRSTTRIRCKHSQESSFS